jgi:hypothetical protein
VLAPRDFKSLAATARSHRGARLSGSGRSSRARGRYPCRAQAIITFNLDDFPDGKLARYNIEARYPDEFVLVASDLAPGLVTATVSEQAASLKSPRRTVGELLDTLRDQRLVRSVGEVAGAFRKVGAIECRWNPVVLAFRKYHFSPHLAQRAGRPSHAW